MERLTQKNGNGYIQLLLDGEIVHIKDNDTLIIAKKLKEYEDFEEIFREKMTDTACDFLSDKEEFGKWLDRNKWIAKKCDEYKNAEEQGLLLRLPCKVGDIIYEIIPLTGKIAQRKIKSIVVCNCPDLTIMYKSGYDYSNVQDDFGKTVFLTKDEAEQKLKEMESDKNV